MSTLVEPSSAAELAERIRSTPRVIAIGAGTKPRLTAVDERFVHISLRQLRGIIEYEPDEFIITALAGTPIKDLAAALDERGQSMPWDPLFLDRGSTLGGAVAANANGPGRFRFGGVRDFILGVRFIDGGGRLLRMGGKVVKNAAGFDVPKFLVGSFGRYGVLVEITLKVFPRPTSRLTLRLETSSIESAVRILTESANSRWQPDALDIPPSADAVLLRLAGPPVALAELANDILAHWPGKSLPDAEAQDVWLELREAQWVPAQNILAKVSLAPDQICPLAHTLRQLPGAGLHVSSGGNMAFISVPSAEALTRIDAHLRQHELSGVIWRGAAPLWLGQRSVTEISRAIKNAFDPDDRFPGLEH